MNKNKEENMEFATKHFVYLKAIIKEEDDFDHIQELLKNKKKIKILLFRFYFCFIIKERNNMEQK